MANRYWVGGTDTWDGTAGTKWALTSNGVGGQAVPTASDDVFFTADSGAVTCTVSGAQVAKSINCTGFTGTLAGTATPSLTISGSLTLVAGMTFSFTGGITLAATGTLTSAGKTLAAVTITAGTAGTITLGDALTMSGQLTLNAGTLTTSNFNLTCTTFLSSNASTRAVNLGSSTVTISSSIAMLQTTNMTFNAGTSQVNVTGGGTTQVTSLTFYNVTFSTAATLQISSCVFNNLTYSNSGSNGLTSYTMSGGSNTVNGTFTCSGSSITARNFLSSNLIGTARAFTVNTLTANNCDFRDITVSGTAAGTSPTNAGDCGGNTGITFPVAKTVYWNLAGTQNWNATGWATTSTGTPDINNFPLPQDTAKFTDDGSAGTVTLVAYNLPAIDASTRTSAMTLSHAAASSIYGSYILGSGLTISGTLGLTFFGRSTMTFTSAGKTITFPITVNAPSGTFQLGDAFSGTNTITHTRGTVDAANYNVTCTTFDSSNSNTRTLTMGSGLWTLSSTGTVWNLATTTGLTFNADTANILLSNTSTTARTFAGGGLSYNTFTIGGSTGISTTTISGAGTSFTTLASTKTVAHTITLSANLGTIGIWSITGSSGNVVTLNSSAAATQRTFSLTNPTTNSRINYLAVQDIGINEANRFYVGPNSTDSGNNSNVYFSFNTLIVMDNVKISTGVKFTYE